MASAPLARAQVEAKRRVVEQVVAGRLTLLDGAARFRALGGSSLPDAEDTEAVCRAVIGWAGLALSDRPERAGAVLTRLEEELRAHLERAGGFRLPAMA
jgi:hypothetical protein